MSPASRVIIIAARPAAMARLLPVFAAAGFEVIVWSLHGSRLGYSRHVARHTDLAEDEPTRHAQLHQLATSLGDRDLVVLGSDHDLRDVADGARSDPALLRLLPIGATYLDAIGTKIGAARLLQEAGLHTPRSASASRRDELARALADVGVPAFVKEDRSGGGQGTTAVDGIAALERVEGTGPWLVEESVPGLLACVDLVVVDGQVAIAPYSIVESTHGGPYGVSIARTFRRLDDDALAEDLDRLAAHLGGTWFANVTAIRRPDGSHAVFELDLRPNVWHAYAPRLGHPLVPALRTLATGEPLAPWRRDVPSVRVVNVMRTVHSALRGEATHLRELVPLRDSLGRAHVGDPRLSYREARDLARDLVLGRWRRLRRADR